MMNVILLLGVIIYSMEDVWIHGLRKILHVLYAERVIDNIEIVL